MLTVDDSTVTLLMLILSIWFLCPSCISAILVHCCISALPSAWFLQSFWLTTHTHAAVWLPKSCNQCVQRDCWEHCSGERKSIVLQQFDCVAHTMHQCAVSRFPISQGNAEALDRWGGKTKHHMILYFLSNIPAKNYRNRIVYAKIIATRRWDVFWRHRVIWT